MKLWKAFLLIMILVGASSFTSAKEEKRADLPDGAVGMHTKMIPLRTTLMTRRGLRGELSPPEKIDVNEVELNFYKMKNGSQNLILSKSYTRAKKDETGHIHSKSLKDLDEDSVQKILEAFLKQHQEYEKGAKALEYKLKPQKRQLQKKPGGSK